MNHGIKDCFHLWCVKQKLTPQYDTGIRGERATLRFVCEVRVKGYDYVGAGSAKSKKEAQRIAANDFVQFLVRLGVMEEEAVPVSIVAPGKTVQSLDADAVQHGNWTLETAKPKLTQYMLLNKVVTKFVYTDIGPEYDRAYEAKLQLYIPQRHKEIYGREIGYSKQAASKSCALSIVRQMYHMGVLPSYNGSLKIQPEKQLINTEASVKGKITPNTLQHASAGGENCQLESPAGGFKQNPPIDCVEEKKKPMVEDLNISCSKCKRRGHFTRECPFIVCSNCKRNGHTSKQCPHQACLNCQQKGHHSNNCSNPPAVKQRNSLENKDLRGTSNSHLQVSRSRSPQTHSPQGSRSPQVKDQLYSQFSIQPSALPIAASAFGKPVNQFNSSEDKDLHGRSNSQLPVTSTGRFRSPLTFNPQIKDEFYSQLLIQPSALPIAASTFGKPLNQRNSLEDKDLRGRSNSHLQVTRTGRSRSPQTRSPQRTRVPQKKDELYSQLLIQPSALSTSASTFGKPVNQFNSLEDKDLHGRSNSQLPVTSTGRFRSAQTFNPQIKDELYSQLSIQPSALPIAASTFGKPLNQFNSSKDKDLRGRSDSQLQVKRTGRSRSPQTRNPPQRTRSPQRSRSPQIIDKLYSQFLFQPRALPIADEASLTFPSCFPIHKPRRNYDYDRNEPSHSPDRYDEDSESSSSSSSERSKSPYGSDTDVSPLRNDIRPRGDANQRRVTGHGSSVPIDTLLHHASIPQPQHTAYSRDNDQNIYSETKDRIIYSSHNAHSKFPISHSPPRICSDNLTPEKVLRPTNTIYISNLPTGCTAKMLRDKCQCVGEIINVDILESNIGIIQYEEMSIAKRAVSLFDGIPFNRSIISVGYTRSHSVHS